MSNYENINQLKEELIRILGNPEIDYERVLELSSNIARLDPDNVRFSVDAGHISRLGRELVGRQETAVSELVKNSYDADASLVELIFENADLPGGRLRIDDNGIGMDRDQLIRGFMRLSSTDKIHNPISPLFRRSRAGRKGIGRFAAQRLGQKLTIITQTATANKAFRVEIDWGRFQGDLDLGTIASRIEEVEKSKDSGTTLLIEKLAEAWTPTSINRVYRYIADLIQPFPLSKVSTNTVIDPGFEVKMYRIANRRKEMVASVEKMVYEYALAEIEGFVDENRRGYWSLKSHQLEIDERLTKIGKERDKPESPFNVLKNVHFKAYYYIYNAGFIPRSQNKLIHDLADERGGIRVYRNGFRVLPYGEPLNDWLELAASSGRRSILPPHANINFLGFVEIIDPEGELFEETASREGLIENSAFHELIDFVSRTLLSAVVRVAEVRNRKTTTGQENWIKEEKTPAEQIKGAAETVNQVADTLESNTSNDNHNDSSQQGQQQAEALRKALREIHDAATSVELMIAELGMLRVLASLGLIIGEFTHEIRHRFPPILLDAKYFQNIHSGQDKHLQVADSLVTNLNTFRMYTAYFDKAVSENTRRELVPQELSVVLRSFYKVVKPAADDTAISIFEPEILGYDLFTCPMHPAEWVSILFNLFSNSRKAIRRAGSQGKIFMKAGREGDRVYVEFADNGDGIAPENEERIFDAFFTTSSPSRPRADEQEELLGTGLGLKIIKDIVSGYNGKIMLVNPPASYSTCFRLELPAARDEEIDLHDR